MLPAFSTRPLASGAGQLLLSWVDLVTQEAVLVGSLVPCRVWGVQDRSLGRPRPTCGAEPPGPFRSGPVSLLPESGMVCVGYTVVVDGPVGSHLFPKRGLELWKCAAGWACWDGLPRRHARLSGITSRCQDASTGDPRSPGPGPKVCIPASWEVDVGLLQVCTVLPWRQRVLENLPLGSDPTDVSVPCANDGHPLLCSQREAASGPRQRDCHHWRAGLPHLPSESGYARGVAPSRVSSAGPGGR